MKPMKTLPLLLLALAAGAQAQDDSDTGWHSSVGMSAGLAPRYLGSDDYHATISPEFSFTDGTFFADSERGLGAQYQNDAGFTASAALNYDPGRTEKNSIYRPGSKELKGMGRVKGSALANVGVSQEITPWLTVGGDVNLPFAGQKHRGQDSAWASAQPCRWATATSSSSAPMRSAAAAITTAPTSASRPNNPHAAATANTKPRRAFTATRRAQAGSTSLTKTGRPARTSA